MNIRAEYLRTVKGLAEYRTFVDGRAYAVGGLPKQITGFGRVSWTLQTGTPNYTGTLENACPACKGTGKCDESDRTGMDAYDDCGACKGIGKLAG